MVRDGGAEGSSAIEDGGPAAVLATPDLDRMHILIRSSQLEASYVGDLLYYRIHASQCHGDHLQLPQLQKTGPRRQNP